MWIWMKKYELKFFFKQMLCLKIKFSAQAFPSSIIKKFGIDLI
jgi:hypothetical protein